MIALIADDFTGAAEVAGLCMRLEIPVSFLVDIPDVETLAAQTSEVLVLAENTRSFTAEGAVKVTRLLADNLKAAGIVRVIKKTDSVLRGWVLPEMQALAEAFGYKRLLIEPANPDTGRRIKDGAYYVNEVLLAETAFNHDPDFPAHSSLVKRLVESRTDGFEPIVPYEIPDAATRQDLSALAEACADDTLAGGSAAFCAACLEAEVRRGRLHRHLSEATEGTCPSGQPAPEEEAGATDHSQTAEGIDLHDTLIVCGSAHQNSLDFSNRLESEGFPVLRMPSALCREAKPSDEDYVNWITACVEAFRSHGRLLVRIEARPSFSKSAEKLLFRMTECVYGILKQIQPSQMLIEGGATACSVLQRLGWNSFTPEREWLPGVVQLHLEPPVGTPAGIFPDCHITLKPGSYAWPKFNL